MPVCWGKSVIVSGGVFGRSLLLADRVSIEFLSTVLENFERDKTIREKYNVVTSSSETNVKTGYSSNVIGFGWTKVRIC
jgi:neutral trehalase